MLIIIIIFFHFTTGIYIHDDESLSLSLSSSGVELSVYKTWGIFGIAAIIMHIQYCCWNEIDLSNSLAHLLCILIYTRLLFSFLHISLLLIILLLFISLLPRAKKRELTKLDKLFMYFSFNWKFFFFGLIWLSRSIRHYKCEYNI